MSARALTSHVDSSAYLETEERFAPDFFYSGDRICPPPAPGRGNMVVRVYAAVFLSLGIGWAVVGKKPAWMSSAIERMSASLASLAADDRAAQPAAPAMTDATRAVSAAGAESVSTAMDPKAASGQSALSSDIAGSSEQIAKDQLATSEAPPVTEVANPPAVAEAPAAPAVISPTDRYQQQAAAVGLNPDISRALLARLSDADYRNAGIAIERAVAKTPDGGEFVWPSRRKPELALFKVHFVQGAAPNCRRYVVTVTKDGWTTTALPMEKCGAGVRRS